MPARSACRDRDRSTSRARSRARDRDRAARSPRHHRRDARRWRVARGSGECFSRLPRERRPGCRRASDCPAGRSGPPSTNATCHGPAPRSHRGGSRKGNVTPSAPSRRRHDQRAGRRYGESQLQRPAGRAAGLRDAPLSRHCIEDDGRPARVGERDPVQRSRGRLDCGGSRRADHRVRRRNSRPRSTTVSRATPARASSGSRPSPVSIRPLPITASRMPSGSGWPKRTPSRIAARRSGGASRSAMARDVGRQPLVGHQPLRRRSRSARMRSNVSSGMNRLGQDQQHFVAFPAARDNASAGHTRRRQLSIRDVVVREPALLQRTSPPPRIRRPFGRWLALPKCASRAGRGTANDS